MVMKMAKQIGMGGSTQGGNSKYLQNFERMSEIEDYNVIKVWVAKYLGPDIGHHD
jgi:hypothetical protein